MRWSPALALLLLAPLLAGCAAAPEDPDLAGEPTGTEGPLATRGPARGSAAPTSGPRPADPGNGTALPANGTGGSGNGTARAWATLGAATIRPGVQVLAEGSQCTSNFLFTSPDNATVYVGFAAHCVTRNDPNQADDGCDPSSDPLEAGTPVEVEGAQHPATLAYSSWLTMQRKGGASEDECLFNDFAVAALDPRDAAKANPAMLFFGGPTALADPGGVATLDKVMTYGDSGLRAGLSALSPHEGYVVLPPGEAGWTTEVYTVPQGIPGDSGSGVLLQDGAALGVLVTISYLGGANGVTTLANAVAYAGAHGGLPLRLATAGVLDEGRLPPL